MRRFFRKYFFQLLPSFTSWLILFSIELYQIVYDLNRGEILFPIPNPVKDFFHFLFLVFIFQAGKNIVKKEAKPTSLEIIWLVVGIGGTGIIINALSNWIRNVYMANYSSIFWYNLDKYIGILTNAYFFITLTFVYRQLILFRSTKTKQNAWFLLDVLIYLGFLGLFEKYFTLYVIFIIAYWVFAFCIIIYLSIHTEWVAYLNFKEKLMGIFFMSIVLIIQLSYLFLINAKYTTDNKFNVLENLDLEVIYLFCLLYTFFCILVLAFNLPTSSLYELRQVERNALNEINKVILKSKADSSEVYNILMNYGMRSAKGDFGWIIFSDNESSRIIQAINCDDHVAMDIHPIINKYWSYQVDKKNFFVGDTARLSLLKNKSHFIGSFFATKICTQDNEYGDLVLGWKHKNVFELELYSFLSIITEQAAIALENKELFKKSITLERYQEQLKIAKDFQDRVLPKIQSTEYFDLHAVNQEADEIGGDYLETYQDNEFFHIFIADVAGKGTTAAFYMAELKGMLQILFPLQLAPIAFIQKLNTAVSNCLSANLFITANYLRIHKSSLKCQFVRAGHTPLLHYSQKDKLVYQYQPKGIGLGILRKELSDKNFDVQELQLQKNDLLLLFTDGIIEARNPNNEELGMDILKDWLASFNNLSSLDINYCILEQMMAFTNEKKFDDDYTLFTLKVK